MNLYLNQEQNRSISLTNNFELHILKSNCKQEPADGEVDAQNKYEIHKYFTYWGGDRKKYNGRRNFF